ncbi:hypothetical protein D3C87_1175710 [compost metagenome]
MCWQVLTIPGRRFLGLCHASQNETAMFKMLLRLPLAILCFLVAVHVLASSKSSFDIVFDLDWTLFYPVDKNGDAETVQLPEGRFRMADGVVDILIRLHRQGHRISAFSGGAAKRNQALVELVTRKIHERGVTDFAFHKVLSFEDLTPRSGVGEDSRFADRWMKDLTKVNPDLSRVILVDDMVKFAPPGQEMNIYWLEKTYNFHAQFDPEQKQSFDPPNEAAWRIERNKIRLFFENFQKVRMNFSDAEFLPALQDLNQGRSLCPRTF